MGKGYVLGLDAGGTKTHCALYNFKSGQLDLKTWGVGNHEGLPGGFEQLHKELAANLVELIGRNNLAFSDIDMAVFGMGGVDTNEQHRIISEMLKKIGVARFILCNDAYLGVKAGAKSGCGICAINGTGASLAGIDDAGGRIQIGGFGEMSGDFGGASMLVTMAIGCVYNELFRGHDKTSMTPAMMTLVGAENRHDFMEKLTALLGSGYGACILEICKILFGEAAKGDVIATGLLEKSGKAYAQAAAGAVRELAFKENKPIEIVLAGSLFTKGACKKQQETMETLLPELLGGRDFVLTPLDTPCVAGAVLWALDEIAVFGHREMVSKELKEMTEK